MQDTWNEHVKGMSTDHLCVTTLRTLAIDMVQAANSGHPGAPMGCAPMAHTLWSRFLKIDPSDPTWMDRDRFVLSNGHASTLLYGLLHINGYDLGLDELKQFRQWGSRTPGHPENHVTPGIETTTGPLGQGFANAVGFAIAESHLASVYNRPNHEIINHRTFVICGDGCLMEGISSEAGSLAGHLGLGKLVVLYDDNGITIDGTTQVSFTEDVCARFEAFGWKTLKVSDGTDTCAIESAIQEAVSQTEKPTLIAVKNCIGFGSPSFHNTSKVHGTPLGAAEIQATKSAYGWPVDASFFVPDRVDEYRKTRISKGKEDHEAWNKRFEAYRAEYPELAAELVARFNNELPEGWEEKLPNFATDEAKGMATRAAGGKVLAGLHAGIPQLMGGSADLAESNKTLVPASGNYSKENPSGRNIFFGIREHAMASICNAMALHGGFISYGATFLVFSDYMRHCIRLGALEKAHAFWIWTHDSIGVGEDGPTHQPIEHFASLRSIPDFLFVRPSDANETKEALKLAVTSKRPVGLALSRQNCKIIDRNVYAKAELLHRGAYTLISDENPEYILMASGSEVDLALAAYKQLHSEGLRGRVVSMPCSRLFDEQDPSYRSSVLPESITKRVAIEAGVSQGWHKYLGFQGKFIGMEHFGASAPAEQLYEQFGLTPDKICSIVRSFN